MSEIEKMYENAGIDKIGNKKCTLAEFSDCQNYCFISENNKCDKFSFDYPPFTAEKELGLIKWFMNSEHFSPVRFNARWVVDDIASYINFLWQILTEEEKQQVKGILE